jgi:hypothetical protein
MATYPVSRNTAFSTRDVAHLNVWTACGRQDAYNLEFEDDEQRRIRGWYSASEPITRPQLWDELQATDVEDWLDSLDAADVTGSAKPRSASLVVGTDLVVQG